MSVKSVFYSLSIATAFVTCVVLLAGVSQYSLSPVSETCFHFGEWIGIAALLILALYLLWKAVFKIKMGRGFFCSALLLFMAISYLSMNDVREEIVRSKKYTTEAVALIENLSQRDPDVAQKNYSTEEYGRWEPFLAVLERSVGPSIQDQQRLNEQVKAVNFDEMFLTNNLCDYEYVSHAKKQLQTLKNQYEKSEAEQERCITEIEAGINALLQGKSAGNPDFEVFGQDLSTTRQTNKEYYRIEKAYIAELARFMGFLMSIQGLYSEDDGGIVFRKSTDERKFNRYVARMEEIIKEASNFYKKDAASTQEEIGNVNLLAAG